MRIDKSFQVSQGRNLSVLRSFKLLISLMFLVGLILSSSQITWSAPSWSSTYPQSGTVTTSSIQILARTDTNSTAYFLCLAAGSPMPSSEQVKAGKNALWVLQPGNSRGLVSLTANVDGNWTATSLGENIAYDIWVVAEDGTGLQASPTKVSMSTSGNAPYWINPYPRTVFDPQGNNSAKIDVQINENGTAYGIAIVTGSPTPSATQVVAGTDASGGSVSANKRQVIPLTANVSSSMKFTGLNQGDGRWDIYIVAVDSLGNIQSAPTTIYFVNTDITPPTWNTGYPTTGTITSSTIEVLPSINENGFVYFVLVPDGATQPSAAQVKAGQNSSGTTVAVNQRGLISIAANTAGSFGPTGLAVTTQYDIWVVAEDAMMNLQAVAVKLDATTLSNNANLSNLVPGSGSLNETFASGTISYTMTVPKTTSSITFTPTVAESHATVTVNGTSVTSGSPSGSIILNVGSNTITVVVTAQDGVTTKTYTVAVTRQPGTASATTSIITASPTSIMANGTATSIITVQLKDSDGDNVITGGAIVTLTTNAGTLSSVTDNLNGTYTATLSSNTAGSATITGTLNTVAISDSASVTLVASTNANLSNLAPSTGTLSPSFDAATTTYTISVPNGTSGITFTPTVAESHATVTVNGVTVTSGSPSGNIPLTVGENTVTVVVTAQDGSTKTYTVTVTRAAASADPAETTITASPTSITADGTSTSTITVQLKDASGTNVATGTGYSVVLATSAGTLSSVTNNNNGIFTATLTAPSSVGAGSLTISGTLNSSAITDTEVITLTPGAATTGQTLITASPTSIAADGSTTSTITVQLKDANGDNLPNGTGYSVALATTTGSLSIVTDHGDGTYTATLTSNTAGTATITGSLNTVAISDNASVTLVASTNANLGNLAPSTGTLSPSFDAATTTYTISVPNGTSGITFTPTVAESHATVTVNGVTVTSGSPSGNIPLTVGENTVAVVVTAQDGSTKTYTVSVTRAAASADPAETTITASPTSITADGTSTSTITVQLKDASGTNVATGVGYSVVLATSAGTLSSVTNNNNGTFTATLTAPTSVGTGSLTISGTLNSSAITDTEVITLTPGAATTGQTLITASPTSIAADGSTTSTITVQLKDANGNNLPNGTGYSVALATTTGSLSIVTDNGDGTYTATLTSNTAGTATITGSLNTFAISDNASVTLVASTNANLGNLAPSTGTLSPSFDAATTTYTISVPNGTSDITFTPTVAESHATVTVNGVTVTSGSPSGNIPLTVGENTVTVVVTAQDGSTKTYTVTVTRAAASADPAETTITASPTSITADGTSTSTITVQLKDASGTNVATGVGYSVVLATSAGTLSSVTNNNNGTFTATLTAPTSVGTGSLTISGTLNSSAITECGGY